MVYMYIYKIHKVHDKGVVKTRYLINQQESMIHNRYNINNTGQPSGEQHRT